MVPTSSPANPGRLLRRVLSEERGGCCSPRLSCGYSRAMLRGTSHDWIRLVGLVFNIQDQRLRQEEEESLFIAGRRSVIV